MKSKLLIAYLAFTILLGQSLFDAQMGQLAHCGRKSTTDLTERIGSGQLAKHHGNKLILTAKALA